MSNCESGTCETKPNANYQQTGQCQPCLPEQECCPIEKSAEKWSGAFFDAMHQVQVEILKEKIRKSWGAQMDKVGDAVAESMGIHWQAVLGRAKAQHDLKESIKNIYLSGKK